MSCHPLGKQKAPSSSSLHEEDLQSLWKNLTSNVTPRFSQNPHYSFETNVVMGEGLAAEQSQVGLDHRYR